MERPYRSAIAVTAFVVGMLLALLLAAPAYGWDAFKSTNGVVLVRESTDATISADLRVYYDYKGGSSWNGSYLPMQSASYNSVATYPGFLGANVSTIEVPLVAAGGRVQLVYCSVGPIQVPVLNEPLNVSVTSFTPTATVSIPETATVSISGIAGASDAEGAIVAILLGSLIALGIFVGLRRVWGGHD